jgi:1-acyl-sn-glycerol-3-phosphate acyltransferase
VGSDTPALAGAPEPSGTPGAAGGIDAAGPPGSPRRWRTPWLWRGALLIAQPVVWPLCRLRVTGEIPAELRGGPVILVANHIGAFDPCVLTAAFARVGIAPRIMATGGLFRAPVVGRLMRMAGHIRVDRRQATVTAALGAAEIALAQGSMVLAYPEGRITLDPAMWPERGKTGVARLAAATGAPVVPVSQWGAHTVLPWGAPRRSLGRLVWALTHRPVVRVHFGPAFTLRDVGQEAMAIRAATDRIIDEITAGLRRLRVDEPRLPRFVDPARPISIARSYRLGDPRSGNPGDVRVVPT